MTVRLRSEACVDRRKQHLLAESSNARYMPVPGMQVNAEIHVGTRSVVDYLLSSVQKATQETGWDC